MEVKRMSKERLFRLMLDEAYDEVRHQGFKFDSQADRQLRELIRSGVRRMSESDVEYRADEAIDNTRLFVRRLCEDHEMRNGRLILENRTFSMARMSICPLWPLC